MKRKLFLTIAVVFILVVVFAFASSAEEITVNKITNDAYGTIYQLSQDPGLENADQYKSILNNIVDSGTEQDTLCILTDGTSYYVFPTSYIIVEFLGNNQKGKFQYATAELNEALAEWDSADENITLPQFETTGAWGNTRIDSLVRIEFSHDVLWFDRQHCLVRSTNLKEAIMHDDIYLNTNLSSGIFNGCASLETVRLSTKYTVITAALFLGCTSFEGVSNWDEIKPNLTSISKEAFYGCKALTSLDVDNGILTSIGDDAFNGCSALVTLKLSDTVSTISQRAFQGCSSLSDFKVPSSLVNLGGKAFQNCSSLVRLEFPPTTKDFGRDCFNGCKNLEYINIPRDCESIGEYTFSGCGKVFIDLSEAKSLKSTGSNNSWGVTTSLVFPDGFLTCAGISSGNITEIVFPNSTTSIGIIQCSSLKEIVIPNGVTQLKDKAFDYCGSLEKITIPKGLTTISTTGNTSFFGTSRNIKTIVYTGNANDAILADIVAILKNATVEYANHCEVYFNGNHKLDGELTKYFKGEKYISKYVEECECGNDCGKVVPVNEIAPLFKFLGYSRSEIPGTYAILNSFGVNYNEIAKYNALVADSEKITEYGLIAAGKSLADGSANVVDGKLMEASKKASVSYTEKTFDLISMKISGFNDEASKSRELYISAYILVGGTYYYSSSVAFSDSANETVTFLETK